MRPVAFPLGALVATAAPPARGGEPAGATLDPRALVFTPGKDFVRYAENRLTRRR